MYKEFSCKTHSSNFFLISLHPISATSKVGIFNLSLLSFHFSFLMQCVSFCWLSSIHRVYCTHSMLIRWMLWNRYCPWNEYDETVRIYRQRLPFPRHSSVALLIWSLLFILVQCNQSFSLGWQIALFSLSCSPARDFKIDYDDKEIPFRWRISNV